MRIRLMLALTLAAFLGAATTASAQIFSVYGTFSGTRVSNLGSGSQTSIFTPGFGGGVTLNMLSVGPVKLGFDLRGSSKPGTDGTDTAMFGFKAAFKAPLIPFKPYVQASGGYLAARARTVTGASAGAAVPTESRYAAYELIGGLDYSIVPFVDLRVIEIGGGQGFNTGSGSQSVPLLTVNTGIVLHF